MLSIKTIITQTFKVCKCLKYKKTKMETPYISKIYEYVHRFEEKKFNFEIYFESMLVVFE